MIIEQGHEDHLDWLWLFCDVSTEQHADFESFRQLSSVKDENTTRKLHS